MTGKRADHGHVDIFVLFNRGPKENYNLKKKITGKRAVHRRADFFRTV